MTPEDAGAAARPFEPEAQTVELPADAMLILPVRNLVLFPGVVMPITIGRARSVAAAQQAVRESRQIGVIMQRNAEEPDPGLSGLNRIGVTANILRYVTAPDGTHHLICQGEQRFSVTSPFIEQPFMAARIDRIAEPTAITSEIEARTINLRNQAIEALQLLPQTPQELIAAIQNAPSPSALVDLVAAYMDSEAAEKQDILETIDLVQRMDKVTRLLAHRIEVLRLSAEIGQQTRQSLDERQREILLREQMAAIQKQLGEGENKEVEEIKAAIAKAEMPAEVEKAALKEATRLERMSDASAEYGMVRTYLDWMVELPWKLPEEPPIDITEARKILDEDHFGLDKIKRRIVEYLAVRKLAPGGKSPILCFAGPPGVGKTSLGQSIARAMNRPFVRVSLGGVHDEAEIRGHRRTYVGALPGNIIQAVRKAGQRNAVMMLDEIDKMGASIQGDPASAMLEVLDPEQNNTFRDNYLAVPFDLSRIVFIATANVLDQIPGPLRDRMEVISLPGYTDEEKLQIAKRYLLKRQLTANGLTPEQVDVEDEALRDIIRGYTREAGVRNLEREIGTALRRIAVQIAEGKITKGKITPADLTELVGPLRFEDEVAMRTSIPGVATGLAWTPVGGDILFIEAARSPGRGGLLLTGQLGEVMRESAQAAMTLVKSEGKRLLGLTDEELSRADVHIHVPAGATPKDGPSAGVAMFVALASLLTGRVVRSDTAMTGEISLRGLVLPVGGIKEKVTAAARAGLKRVMLPARNKRDFEDIPEDARAQLEFIWLERVEEAVAAALEPAAQK
jgi:ATP-dependent Lon protease